MEIYISCVYFSKLLFTFQGILAKVWVKVSLFVHESLAGKLEMIRLQNKNTITDGGSTATCELIAVYECLCLRRVGVELPGQLKIKHWTHL